MTCACSPPRLGVPPRPSSPPPMKSTWLLIVGIAVGVLGASAYLSISHRSRPVGDTPTAEVRMGAKSSDGSSRRYKSVWADLGSGRKEKRSVATSTPNPVLPVTAMTQSGASKAAAAPPTTIDADPTEQELALAADRINRQATQKLDHLAQILDLSEEQQDQIFPLLARSSQAYHPSLAIEVTASTSGSAKDRRDSEQAAKGSDGEDANNSGSNEPLPANEADEQIHDVLTTEQKERLEDEIIDADLWWTEIIADLEDELDESTRVAAQPEPEEPDSSYEGNAGIGNLLRQSAGQAPDTNSAGAESKELPSFGRDRGF